MITAFQIVEPAQDHALLRYFSRLRHNQIKVEHLYCDRAAVKNITYLKYRKNVNWGAVDRFVKAQRNHLLCPKGMDLPDNLGYRRFSSGELAVRMCENAALFLLDNLKKLREALPDEDGAEERWKRLSDPKVAVADDTEGSLGLLSYLFECCQDVTAVTKRPEIFLEEGERLLLETGAVLKISKSPEALRKADLIIAPNGLEEGTPFRSEAVVLLAKRPTYKPRENEIFRYSIDLPQKLRNIQPDYLDDMYFASALYAMGNVHELGSELFSFCGGESVIHTRASLLRMFLNAVESKGSESDSGS